MAGERIHIRGTVQGVGFRPTVAVWARKLGLAGWVRNGPEGVEIALQADSDRVDGFLAALTEGLPPLAAIASVHRAPDPELEAEGFAILDSEAGKGAPRAVVAPDAASCPACLAEVLDPLARRYRYPFTTCTHCGPRYSIVEDIPYDRARTTMARFPMCDACRAEYEDPANRRYHAEPIACFTCGPRASLRRADGRAFTAEAFSMLDDVDAVASLLMRGEIVAIRGLGGYQLCCDATSAAAVARLRERKRRPEQPLALMVRDLDVARRYVKLEPDDETLLRSPAGPIVLAPAQTPAEGVRPLADGVAPMQACLGVMLPTTPLHHLMLRRLDRPVVCTSGNRHQEPMCTEPGTAAERLSAVADWFLEHDRPIARRIDDSVVRRLGGAPRILRRARGYAPSWHPLPDHAPRILAVGGQLKSSFAIADGDRTLLSPHQGDLDEVEAFDGYLQTYASLCRLYGFAPEIVAVDLHSGYRSAAWGRALAAEKGLAVVEVQHHHAHVAACLAEHGWQPRHEEDVALGIALDGLGMGPNGELWGGEVLLARYDAYSRLGTLKPVAMLGGDKASREPWRNLYAHLRAEMSWSELEMNFGTVAPIRALAERPRDLLDQMLDSGVACPPASSCGRLFDAVAAALDLYPERISFEGQAAMALEACVTDEALREARQGEHYPMGTPNLGGDGLPYVEHLGMWRAILGDLHAGVDRALIAARFHVALSDGLVLLARRALRQCPHLRVAALSGGCFQNGVLLALVTDALTALGLDVLTHAEIPANDGGIAFGQVAIAAATASRPDAS
ncbi:MAG: carbamoyltransferase HypF [Myxococcota bacterium]